MLFSILPLILPLVLAGVRVGAASACTPGDGTRHVAVVGAGPAGASTAYHLQQMAAAANVSVRVTVYEKTDHIGGRTLTVDAFGDAREPVELGASIYADINTLMWNAVGALNLTTTSTPDGAGLGRYGFWNGTDFVLVEDQTRPADVRFAELVARYGAASFVALDSIVADAVARYARVYDAPVLPFASLTDAVAAVGLDAYTGATADDVFAAHNVSAALVHDFVAPLSRTNYALNLASMQSLLPLLTLGAAKIAQVAGGNWRLFAAMVESAVDAGVATFRPNTTVTAVTRLSPAGAPPKYAVTTADGSAEIYDNIVLASPLQSSGLALGADVLTTPIEPIPYIRLHVTVFATTRNLSTTYFGTDPVPHQILTTLADTDSPTGTGTPGGVGAAGFWSLTTLRTAVNPVTGQRETLYKLFSPEPATPAFLSDVLDTAVPPGFVADGGISWIHARAFDSYPVETTRTTFVGPVVGDGVYYTSGIETFVSCMDTAALAGKSVAQLIVSSMQ